jgi:hypothetical protein
LAEFAKPFFEVIGDIVNKIPNSIGRNYFFTLRPNFEASQEEIDTFEAYLASR